MSGNAMVSQASKGSPKGTMSGGICRNRNVGKGKSLTARKKSVPRYGQSCLRSRIKNRTRENHREKGARMTCPSRCEEGGGNTQKREDQIARRAEEEGSGKDVEVVYGSFRQEPDEGEGGKKT